MDPIPQKKSPTRDERIAAALEGVDMTKPDFSIDRLYAEKFPAEVDLHTFRLAAVAELKKIPSPKA